MRNLQALSALAVLALSSNVRANQVNVYLPIANKELAPDGFTRTSTVAGGVFPGPLISGNKGDRFQINVDDKLDDPTLHRSTSIHWHGLFQAGTNEMDGGAFVNQCPIVPGHSFLYNFTSHDQAGTFWYHSHMSTQYCDGLRGPLVVYDPNDPYKANYTVDNDETVITLADWYHRKSTILAPGGTTATPAPDSTTINGLGRYPDGTYNDGDNLAVIRAQPGKSHRFRIVSTSCSPSWNFSIDGHTMTVIEADGVTTKPVQNVTSLDIYAGQRYSVIVTANQKVDNYWIRANPSAGPAGFTNGINSAILRYDGAPSVQPPPSTPPVSTHHLKETELHPLENPGAPGGRTLGAVDYDLTLPITTVNGTFQVNGTAFVPPNVPVLLQILSGNHSAVDLMPKGSVYDLKRNQVVQVRIPGGFAHPFHLHGHTFDVIQSADSAGVINYDDPVRRDVVSTRGGIIFRFVTDNPGPWFLHCHIEWHLEAGMAIVFAERVDETAAANPVPPSWNELCPLYEQTLPDQAFNHSIPHRL